jgi:hypothetical protein
MEQLRNIFISSCIEAAARKVGCSTSVMYRRMEPISGADYSYQLDMDAEY